MLTIRDPSSFRDPAGFVFTHGGVLYRQANAAYAEPYHALMRSGLYDALVSRGVLVPHKKVALRLPDAPPASAVIQPETIPFISYPYEWCFSELKAAALLTLGIQRHALGMGLSLRDASAFNVQFIGCRPIFIDSLSFAPHQDGTPWRAYRQFCQHFLGPLALMEMSQGATSGLHRTYIDGIPLNVTAGLLPLRSWFRPGLLLHLHLHARMASNAARVSSAALTARPMRTTALLGLIDSLQRAVEELTYRVPTTLWSTYKHHHTYSGAALAHKRKLVTEMLEATGATDAAHTVWDLGANDGTFSRIASARGARVLAFDADPATVEQHYQEISRGLANVLPLVQDLANPSPALGWNGEERRSLQQRGPADVVLALALIHHLAIGNQVPLEQVARFLAASGRHLIIEFVPREDSQVQRMLAFSEHSYPAYTRPEFELAFGRQFYIRRAAPIHETARTLYLMERRQ